MLTKHAMSSHCMLTKKVEREGTGKIAVRLDGWRVGDFGQQRDDGGGCETMREKYERVESPGAFVDD